MTKHQLQFANYQIEWNIKTHSVLKFSMIVFKFTRHVNRFPATEINFRGF